MDEHEQYLHDFLSVFDSLEYWGPGSEEETKKALGLLSHRPQNILEIGCGNGNSTITLAELTNATIIATDNEQSALDRLEKKLATKGLKPRVSTRCVSMTELDYEDEKFDLIWAEASLYVMGVINALKSFKPLLNIKGALVFSDLVWLNENPNIASVDFWKNEYPDMQTVENRCSQIEKAGYQVLNTFTISKKSWQNYYEPLQTRLDSFGAQKNESQAMLDIQNEINLYRNHLDDFGYQFFILGKA